MAVSASPGSPIMRRLPRDRRLPLGRDGQPDEKHRDRREPEDDRQDHGEGSTAIPGSGESIRIIDPKIRLTSPPAVSRP